MVGRPIEILASRDDHSLEFNEDALAAVLLQEHVKDKRMVVISVAGALWKGKSFLLDFLLRYMATQGNIGSMNNGNSILEGYYWPEGSKRDTAGIRMWPEVFVTGLSNLEQVAVILLDTQAAFESEGEVRDSATVFTLSTLMSSVQIYTLSRNIQQDDLQHLQFITEYGRLAEDNGGHAPFQKLQFVVNDWNFPYDANYGPKGGEEILNRRFQESDEQHPETQSLRKYIKSCFSDISCFLIPHAGLKVATNPDCGENLPDVEPYFVKQLHKLVTLTLAPHNLVVKEISGQQVNAKELLQYFKSFFEVFNGGKLPEATTVLLATGEANNLAAVTAAKDTYTELMEELCGGAKPHLNTAHLEAQHRIIKYKSLQQFINRSKIGSQQFSEPFKEMLSAELDGLYGQFRMRNESKNFRGVRAAVLYAVATALCILYSIFARA
jgi:atlastin